jgi:predicted nucleic-acid-binding protein
MIGLDTNIVVRYLTHDDPAQTGKAIDLFASLSGDAPGFLSLIALVESVWVLERSYGFKKEEIVQVVETFLRGREVIVERAELVSQALRGFNSTGVNFSDCLIERCGHAAECDYTATFDRRATAVGMRLI